MSAQHKFEAGQSLGQFVILNRAESRGGHVRWNLECTSCGNTQAARATDIHRDAVRCACRKPAAAASIVSATGNSPDTEDMLRTLAEQSHTIAQMSNTLQQVLEEVRNLRTSAAPASASATPKPKGLQSFSMVKEIKPMSLEEILREYPDLSREEKMRKSMLRAKILADSVVELTPEEKAELDGRRRAERADIEADPDQERAARRREFLNIVDDLCGD
jgi:hypothetical protein